MISYSLHQQFGGAETQRDSAFILLYKGPFLCILIGTLGPTKISHCNGGSIMWFDQQKHWYTKEETGADFCIGIYFCCFLLLFNNKGEETELEHSSAARITRACKTKWVLISSNFISTLPVDICAHAFGSHNTRLTLSNNFPLLIPLTVWRKGPKQGLNITWQCFPSAMWQTDTPLFLARKHEGKSDFSEWDSSELGLREPGLRPGLCYLLSGCVIWGRRLHPSGLLRPNWETRCSDYLIPKGALPPTIVLKFLKSLIQWSCQASQHFGFGLSSNYPACWLRGRGGCAINYAYL